MGAADIKVELQQMIEDETDLTVLEAIRTLLLRASLNHELREKLTSRALKSEDDIKEGRLLTEDEIKRRTTR